MLSCASSKVSPSLSELSALEDIGPFSAIVLVCPAERGAVESKGVRVIYARGCSVMPAKREATN